MALDDLKKKIFERDEHFDERLEEPHLYEKKEKVSTSWNEEALEPPVEMIQKQRRVHKIMWGGLLVAFGIFAIFAGMYFFYSQFSGGGRDVADHIDIRIEDADEVVSGDRAAWRVIVKNNNAVALENAELVFEFPPTAQALGGSLIKEGLKKESRLLGEMNPGQTKEETFSALIFGSKDENVAGRAVLEFRPAGTSARFSKEISYSSKIISALLGVDVTFPQEVRAGQDMTLTFRAISSAEKPFEGLAAKVEYPNGFEFVSAVPEPTRGNNVWILPSLDRGSSFDLVIKGRAKDAVEAQHVIAGVGVYDRIDNSFKSLTGVTKTFSVSAPLLSVRLEADEGSLLADGVAVAARPVNMTLFWKNNLPVAVRNAVIEVKFSGEALDLKTVQSLGGEFSAFTNSLQWAAGRSKELLVVNPGASGSFSFTFTPRKDLFGEGSSRNPVVKVSASMRALETPIGFEGVNITGNSEKEFKVASRFSFAQKGYYYDSRLQNSGPLPPRVGQETTYTIVWSLLNTTNDVQNVTVRATLPTYVSWKNIVTPNDSSLKFNANTRELIWTPGTINAGVGYVTPTREVAFQLGLVPSLPQVGRSLELISQATAEGKDSFTSQMLTTTGALVNTDMRDDTKAFQAGGKVKE